jgi:hypothetical protein
VLQVWLRRVWATVAPAQTRLILYSAQSVLNSKACRVNSNSSRKMNVEYKLVGSSNQWWVFDRPANGLLLSTEERSTRKRASTIEALALVDANVVAKFSKDVSGTVAKTTLDTFARKIGSSGCSNPKPLDKVHLKSWGFYQTEKEERAGEIAEEILGSTEEELREELDAFTSLTADAKQKAAAAQAAGDVQEAAKWAQEAARHTQKMSVASLKLRLAPQACLTTRPDEASAREPLSLEDLAPQASLTNGSEDAPAQEQLSLEDLACCFLGPEEPSAQEQLSLEDSVAQTEARAEQLTERIVEDGRKSIFEWVYGRADVITCYVKPKMGHAQRVRYIRSKNANPTPVEFATLFMELNTDERIVEPGKNAFASCLKAHKLHDDSFNFAALPEHVREEYKRICEKSSGCAVCGKAVAHDKVHCSKKCAANACEACNGPVVLKETQREVLDQEPARKIHSLKGILSLRGMKEPLSYQEQLEQYHPDCRAKISYHGACNDCQEKYNAWSDQQTDWNQFGGKSKAWWEAQQAQLEELQKLPTMKTVVERKRVCAAGCSGEERADKRRRKEDDAFEAEQKRRRSMFGAEP